MMSTLPIGPHILNISLKRIKYACEDMDDDYERVAERADGLLAREFDENIFDPETIEDIRYALEMIVLFAYSGSKENILRLLGHIRKILDQIFIPYLLVSHRIYGTITPIATTGNDMGIIDDLPELVRFKIMNTIFDLL